jgi:hypothetical protein
VKALVVATILLVSCGPVSSAPDATPTNSAAAATPTASPTATVAAGLTRYVSTELGYSVDLPAGWRRASCSQGIVTTSPLESSEWFIGVPDAEEAIAPGVRLIQVRVVASDGLTPLAWLERNASDPDARFEPTTLNERAGARGYLASSKETYGFALAARGWIYAIDRAYFGTADQELERTLSTLRILDDATVGRVATATPVPRTVESLADALADGFRRKDVTALADLLAPCVTVGAVPGDPVMRSRAAYLAGLAAEFAAGASVQVQSRPIENDPNFGRFVRSTWSKPGEPDRRVDLLLRANGDRWSVVAILIRTQET